jgi:hypothetical protein
MPLRDWAASTCCKELLQHGSFAVTFYTHSFISTVAEKNKKESSSAKLGVKRKEKKRKMEERRHQIREEGAGAAPTSC